MKEFVGRNSDMVNVDDAEEQASLAFHQWFPAHLSEHLCGRAWLVWRFINGFQHSSVNICVEEHG